MAERIKLRVRHLPPPPPEYVYAERVEPGVWAVEEPGRAGDPVRLRASEILEHFALVAPNLALASDLAEERLADVKREESGE